MGGERRVADSGAAVSPSAFDPRAHAQKLGLDRDLAERLWARLADDPRGQITADPARWRVETFIGLLERGASETSTDAVPGKRTHASAGARGASAGAGVPGRRSLVEEEAARWASEAPTSTDLPYRTELEQIFGTSFGSVRAYVGQDALLAPHGAHAAAWREGVAFAGRPSKALVAHELAHVVQLRNAAGRPGTSRPSDASEREADAVAHAVARGARRVSVVTTRAAALSFSPDPGPQSQGKPASMANVVGDAIDRAQHTRGSFAVAFRAVRGLDAAISAEEARRRLRGDTRARAAHRGRAEEAPRSRVSGRSQGAR